jgi:hypothetical protein
VLLDESTRPWLIEVNTCPALGTATDVDKEVKRPMLAQLMHMVGPPLLHTAAAVSRPARPPMPVCYHCTARWIHDKHSHSDALYLTRRQPTRARASLLMSVCLQARPATPWRCDTPTGSRWNSAAAQAFSFDGVPDCELPSVVRDSEAEWARRGCWQRCLPACHAPRRYEKLYEHERWEDLLLWRWLERKRALDTDAAKWQPPQPLVQL